MTSLSVEQDQCGVGGQPTEVCRTDDRRSVRNRLCVYIVGRNGGPENILDVRIALIQNLVAANNINRCWRIACRTGIAARANGDNGIDVIARDLTFVLSKSRRAAHSSR